MNNILAFLSTIEKYGVPKNLLFEPIDLYESKNVVRVIYCLLGLYSLYLKRTGTLARKIRLSDGEVFLAIPFPVTL